jgi:hypothetical protein
LKEQCPNPNDFGTAEFIAETPKDGEAIFQNHPKRFTGWGFRGVEGSPPERPRFHLRPARVLLISKIGLHMRVQFSTQWKNFRRFFHAMEKLLPYFPHNGINVSTVWKTLF